MTRIRHILRYWKLGVHLVLRTRRFGVNNEWWSSFDSIFGWGLCRKLWSVILVGPIIDNVRLVEFRARQCHFMSDEEYEVIFGRKKTDPPLTY